MATTWGYDPVDRLTLVEHRQTAGGTVLFSAASAYDAVGRRIEQVDYDSARATGGGYPLPTGLPMLRGGPSLGAPAGLQSPRGGPLQGAPSGLPAPRSTVLPAIMVQTFTYDAAWRLLSEARDGSPTTTWTYDDAGNRLTKTSGGVTTSYVYDADNRLTSQTTGGQTTTYANDARGLATVLQETRAGSTTSYVPGIGQYDPTRPDETTRWGYLLADAQNNRLLVDGAGALAHRWEWEPFGRTRAEVGSATAPFGFGGEQDDDETGLVNLRARYYDPSIGRFLSRDSLAGSLTNGQSWNRYSYVENDPINHLDPSGHKKKSKKIKWPGGQDPDDDDDRAKKKAKACKNPGQYTGSCKGGPPNAAYAADGEAQHEAKLAGRAASAGDLAAAAAHLQAAAHFAGIAGTSAAHTATMQAYASIVAAVQAIQAAHRIDNQSPTNAASGSTGTLFYRCGLDQMCEDGGDGANPLLGSPMSSLDDGNDCTMVAGDVSGVHVGCLNMPFIGEAPVPVFVNGQLVWTTGPFLASPGGPGGGAGGSGSHQPGRNSDGGITLVVGRVIHVFDRHTSAGKNNYNASKFYDHEDYVDLIRDAAHHPSRRQRQGIYETTVDVGNRFVGVDQRGKPTSKYTVVTTFSGNLVTAHPGEP